MGFEPTTSRATTWHSNQLSYSHHLWKLRQLSRSYGALEGTRTPDPLLRRQLLYPAELQAHKNGAGDGNRTHTTSLEGWDSTIELHPHFGTKAILSQDFLNVNRNIENFIFYIKGRCLSCRPFVSYARLIIIFSPLSPSIFTISPTTPLLIAASTEFA